MKTHRPTSIKIKLLTLLLQCLTVSVAFSQSLSLPYYTGFDSISEQAGWQEFRLGTLSSFSWSYSVNSVSPPYSLFHDYNVGGNLTDTIIDWFVSPPLNFETPALLNLKLFAQYLFGDTSEYFGIWFGEGSNNPANGNFYELANLTVMQTQFQWVDTSFIINSFADSGYIAFKFINTGDDWIQIFIDNINIIPENKGTIDSLKIIPSNPTMNDSIKIISFTQFPVGDCFLKNSYLNINGNEIVINSTHFEGGWPVICNSIDTITIGKLDTGAYSLYYNLSVDTNLAIFDTDTLFFVVQNPTNVFVLPYETSQIKVYPNPFNTTTTIFIDEELLTSPLEIRMYDIFGREIRQINKIGNKEIQITRDNLTDGLYFIQVIRDDKIIDSRKIIVE